MQIRDDKFRLFAGSSHALFAQEIAALLGVELSGAKVERFPDGECSVELLDNVRDCDVFLVQTIARQPNDFLMELCIMVDACKRAAARSITAVIPYFGYARQDRRNKARVPITAKLVADLLEASGVSQVITLDLHTDQIQGFFNIPVENLQARPVLTAYLENELARPLVVVAPDVGSVRLSRDFAKDLDAQLAVVDKRRLNAEATQAQALIGNVKGTHVLLVDDMCTTASTLCSAARACSGALSIRAVVTHDLLLLSGIERFLESPIERLYVTNSIPPGTCFVGSFPIDRGSYVTERVSTISVASLFAEAIARTHYGMSVSTLFI